MKYTDYFKNQIRQKRAYLRDEWLEQAISAPIRTEVQENKRIRHWIFLPDVGKYLRVVTEPDGETVHNAFYDRRFKEDRK